MSFLASPWLFGLFALLPAIVIMYMLKLKRRRVVVPSTLLWRRSVQDMIANAPFQKLRNNLLMYLQLLLLTLLILAALRPVMKLQDLGGTTLILLIDNSASMQVREDDGVTRLEKAKKAALDAVATMRSDSDRRLFRGSADEVAVYTVADRTRPVQALTGDLGAVRNAIEGIAAVDTESTLEEAGLLLQGLTTTPDATGESRQPLENAKTILISDGLVASPDALATIPNVEYVKIGESSDNVGITGVDVRESYSNTYEYQIFVSVTNSRPEEMEAFVELEAGGEVLDLKSVTVEPKGTAGLVFTTGEQLDTLATVRLVDHKDALALDDQARVRLTPPQDTRVLLVSDGNFFFERVLTVDPRVKVSRTSPSAYTPSDEYDIVIFDGVPVAELGAGNFLLVNTLPPLPGYKAAEERVKNPEIIDWNRVHPLTRFANFEDVLINDSIVMEAPLSAIPIVEAAQTPLIVLQESELQKVVTVGFDIFSSYWPLDVSFPIFMANLLDYFGRSGVGLFQPSYQTGTTIPLIPTTEETAATVTRPDGETREFDFTGASTAYLTDTDKAGIYQVQYTGSTRSELLPVNLLAEAESLVEPVDSIKIADKILLGTDQTVRTDREIWPWLVLAALALLLVEWVIYCRRTFM